jgi:serine protease Do
MSENLAYTVTQGIVSATGRSNVGLADYEDFIQTDCAINPGNSGGPLVNCDGKLVGLNSAIVSRTGGFEGIGFAIPSNMAQNVMTSLIHNGKVVRGWLGVTIQNVDQQIAAAMNLSKTNGALVGDVLSDSPADKAGLKPGDLILGVNGNTIKNSSELRNMIAEMAPGTTVQLDILRDQSKETVSVKLGELPANAALAAAGGSETKDLLGFTVSNIDDNTANAYNLDKSIPGVVVTSIDMSSDAYRAGLREGDVIRSFEQSRIHNVKEFSDIASELKKGETVLLRVTRDGGTFYIAFRVS